MDMRHQKEVFMVRGLWAWLHGVKKRRAFSFLDERYIETLGFVPKDLEREKKKRVECLLSIFLSHLHLLQIFFFNFWKNLRDLKKKSRSANKMVFAWASTLEKTDQIETSSGLSVETEHMCGCKQPAKILFTTFISSDDRRSSLRYRVLNSDRCRFNLLLTCTHADFIFLIF